MIVDPDPEFEKLLAEGSAPATGYLRKMVEAIGVGAKLSGRELILPGHLEVFDPEKIIEGYGVGFDQDAIELQVFRSIDSTNDRVVSQLGREGMHTRVALAEMQSAGKGRRGRAWVSPFGRNIYVTVGRFLKPVSGELGGLSLVVGMQLVDELRSSGLSDVGLKWPNDILLDGGKLAGILIELTPAEPRGVGVAVGVGVNLFLGEEDATGIDQAWSQAGSRLAIGRNRLAGRLIRRLVRSMDMFEREGFAPFVGDWNRFDLYYGERVSVIRGDMTVEGMDRGVTPSGDLLLENEQGLVPYSSGEVSLRSVD